MPELKVDLGYFKMIADLYGRKCPCWGGKYSCPCPPFLETEKCRCGAVRNLSDPKGQKATFRTYKINLEALAEIADNGYRCPKNVERTCFCREFLESGKCEANILEESGNSP